MLIFIKPMDDWFGYCQQYSIIQMPTLLGPLRIMASPIPFIILSIIFIVTASQATLNITTNKDRINALAIYTFTITFPTSSTRTSLTLNFPTQLTLSNSTTTVQINSVSVPSTIYPANSSILINRNFNTSQSVVVSNVQNPSTTISTFSFTITTSISSDATSPNIFNTINYTPGSLQSCLYTFTGTTQQTNSSLQAALNISDSIPSGSSQIVIGYPNQWPNSNSLSMTSGNPTLTCSYSLNSSTTSTSMACSYDSANVYASMTNSNSIPANTLITVLVNGVNCPPTVTTASSAAFKISTYNTGSLIDTLASCNISNTAVSSNNGAFTSPNLPINSLYSSPQINFTNSVPVTFQVGDTMQAYYSPTTTSCSNNLYLNRSAATTWAYSMTTGGVRYYNYGSNADNAFLSSALQLYMECSFNMPASAQPTTFVFLFLRNGSNYLNLTATLAAQAAAFANPSRYILSLTTTQAVVPSTYSFTITLSQPLSAAAAVWLLLPNAINPAAFTPNSSCSATLSNLPLALTSCTYANASTSINFIMTLNYTALIPAGTQLGFVINGLSNPRYAYRPFSFGINTYYNVSQTASLVEYSSSIASLSYTTYTTLNLYLTPNTFSVFTITSANLSYVNQVYLYSGTVISFVFPAAVTAVTFSSLVYTNTTLTTINSSSVSSSSPITLMFTYYQDIPIGTNLTIPFSMITPANIGVYGPISFSTSNNADIYQQSSFLQMAVTQTSPISVQISVPSTSPSAQYTGASTYLAFSLTSYMPQSTPYFYLVIILPSDFAFTTNAPCSGACYSNYSILNSSALNVTMNNTYTFTNNFYTYSIKLGMFTNPRRVGLSGTWYFQTYTKDGSQVGSGSSNFQVTLPNAMNGILSVGDSYYLNNSSPVTLYLNLSNTLTAGDYFLVQFGPSTYSSPSNSVSCPLNLATCTVSVQSTTNILVVTAVPNLNQLNIKTITLQFSGLLSSSSSIYNAISYFNISSYTSAGLLIDSGSVGYNISCGERPSYSCRTCYSNGSCISCYTSQGMNILSGRCVSNCTLETQFQRYSQNGACTSCTNNCYTCYNETYCRTCQPGYYYFTNYSCLPNCATNNGQYISITGGVSYCLLCFDQAQCLSCKNSDPNGCTMCGVGVLDQGVCLSSCSDPNAYLSPGNVCSPCSSSCNGCLGPSYSQCTSCNFGYYNSSGYCVTNCPSGTVAIISLQSCGCQGSCLTCTNSSTYCLSCANSSSNQVQWAYLGQCRSSCPTSSYILGTACIPCSEGCINCSATVCYQCSTSRYSYQNQCLQDCNSLGFQYDGDSSGSTKICVLCPDGCNTCTGYLCTSCLADYTLQNQTCIKNCLIIGNCASPVPAKVIPLPGLIAAGVWALLVVVIKLLLKRLYVPYSLLMIFCLAEVVLVIASITVLNDSPSEANSTAIGRLLLGMDYSYRLTIRGLLIAALVLNYITNILYVVVFCKYIRPLIVNPRQIDYIVNIAILTISTVSNYRFGLIAYSRMFPKPEIRIDNPSKLTPINYLAVTSLVLDLITLSAAVVLIYKEQALTDLFMLGVDLLILLTLNLAVTIWFVAVPKDEEYYSNDVKKTEIEETYKNTEQNFQNQKNISYNKLYTSHHNVDKLQSVQVEDQLVHPLDNHTIAMMASNPNNQFLVSSQEGDMPLPVIGHSTIRKIDKNSNLNNSLKLNNMQNIDNHQAIDEVIVLAHPSPSKSPKKNHLSPEHLENKKTKRVINNQPIKSKQEKGERQEQNLQKKVTEQSINFSKHKIKRHQSPIKYSHPTLIHKQQTKQITIIGSQKSKQAESNQYLPIVHKHHDISHPPETRSNTTPINLAKNKQKSGRRKQKMSDNKLMVKSQRVFDSSNSDKQSQSSNINLDAIIQSKIKNSKFIDSKISQENDRKPELNEDISPSWFNNQNQRVQILKVEELQ